MMYNQGFAAAIKVNGRVLRENGDTVNLPFGSEYTILLKNLNTVRAMVRVVIDGQDVCDDTWLIINPNSTINLERSIRNGNLSQGNKFKFIERTAGIENYRGIGMEDGLIRVEYKFEIPQYRPRINYFRSNESTHFGVRGGGFTKGLSDNYLGSRGISGQSVGGTSDTDSLSDSLGEGEMRCMNFADTSGTTFSASASTTPTSNVNVNVNVTQPVPQVNDAGITVDGGISNQQFHLVDSFPTEVSSHMIIFRLKGAVGQQVITEPVTVNVKNRCPSCGHTNRHAAKFCAECGTGLQVPAGDETVLGIG